MGGESKVTWNPYSKGYFEDPYKHLKECREQNPIHKGSHGAWMFFRHKESYEILRSSKYQVSELSQYFLEKEPYIFKESACPYLSAGTKKWAMYLNGEDHKNARLVMGKAFKEFDLPVILSESVEEVNQKFKNEQDFDLVTYCAYFIFQVIKRFYSLPDNYSFSQIKKYSNMIARSQDLFVPKQVYQEINKWFLSGNEMFNNINSKQGYKENLMAISNKLGISYDNEDILSILAVSLMAAFETSKDSLSMALLELIDKPLLMEAVLASDEEQLSAIIEELFRFTAPLQYTVRVNKEPVEYEGHTIEANSKLYLCIASANRDPAVFQNPDQLIFSRPGTNHLAFGSGPHVCAGANIARQEMKYCLKHMLEFLKDYEINNSEPITYAKQIMMRTIESARLRKKQHALS
ncbi:cytochrome P450 [Mucilaginibacter sp. Bleaf8]|uniref:cytochrome P450 n=1 Tax=Mucilaginibacter sp. Bleaf8 TaxID=2834430 RepID=UPI001BD0422E|nr:cytochrome P450 [Mucilaginibacter sp. Bleaf8]MBS7562914.1 cytochrome P450 [Mucilaginibacter sp. Bleaf8]